VRVQKMEKILLRFEQSDDLLTHKTGFIVLNESWKKYKLSERIDLAFGNPGSNRGFKPSTYVKAIVEVLLDGGEHLEDVKKLESDTGYKKIIGINNYPTADAIGDWLRRLGSEEGENKLWSVNRYLTKLDEDHLGILDIDSSIIESDKGDGEKSYTGVVGYHPLLGMTVKNGLCVGSKFRYGNEYAGDKLDEFIKECEKNVKGEIKIIRSDSAGYQSKIINYCTESGKYFCITADHDESVKASIKKIEKDQWKWGKNEDGSRAEWKVAETIHTMNKTKESFRLVVKRQKLHGQLGLFNEDGYGYWIISTNLPVEQYDSNAVVLFQQGRGEMERLIGELKHHFNMEHMPCGQITANSLYFTIGVLTYNIIQILKNHVLGEYWKTKTIKTIRYRLFQLPSRIVKSSRYMIVKIVTAKEYFDNIVFAYNKLKFAPS
jgi:hypothetical protein